MSRSFAVATRLTVACACGADYTVDVSARVWREPDGDGLEDVTAEPITCEDCGQPLPLAARLDTLTVEDFR